MRVFQILNAILAIAVVLCTAQHGVDPAYLQQYYQQVASQAGHRAAAGANQESTPIFESNGEQPQQYINPGQQIRLKDNVQNQVRAQQPQHTQAYVAPSVREYLQQQQQQQQPQQLQYVSQPQPVAYKQNVAKQQLLRRPQEEYQVQGGKFAKEEADDYDPNPSYQFGFDVKDDEFTNYQNRKEVRDGNVIKGSYSVVDSDGFIRTVKYTADPKEGFKAEVIREPTDIVVKVPTPAPAQLLRQQQDQGHQQYLRQQDQGHQQYQVKPQQQYYQQ